MMNLYLKTILAAGGLLLVATAPLSADDDMPRALRRALETPLPSREVDALLQTKPTTAPECFQAANVLARLERADLAKEFLARILAMNLNREQLAELADRFGSPAFLALAAEPELNPEAGQLADAVLTAAREVRQDAGRVKRLISQLGAPSAVERNQAMMGLLEAGEAALGPMMASLADPQREAERALVRSALVTMEGQAIGPLLGVLEDGGPELTGQAVRILAALKADRAVPRLLGIAFAPEHDAELRRVAQAAVEHIVGSRPTAADAVRTLVEQAREYFDHKRPMPGAMEGRVELWHWDAARQSLEPKLYSEDAARRLLAARLARDAHAIAPERPEAKLLSLTTMLEVAAFDRGLGKPLPLEEGSPAARALQAGPRMLEAVMQEAIAGGHLGAAAAAASLLGEAAAGRREDASGGESELAELLIHQGAQPSPLVRAAVHADRRVRMAALESIVALQPARPFAGSHYLPQSLAFTASTGGEPKALLAGPKREEMLRLAGFLAARGIGVDTATNGREMLRMAAASPDYVLALVDSRLDNPTIDVAVQRLRHDYRGADLRVGVVARADEFTRAEHMVRNDPAVLWFAWPHDEATFDWQFDRIMAIDAAHAVPPEERRQMASRAMDLLLEISRPEHSVFEVRHLREAALNGLYVPELAERATVLAGRLGVPAAQGALVDLAARDTAPLALRQAAGAAFGASVQRHGILLTTAEILKQYDRYNASGARDEATQRVLAQVLDDLEAPTRETPKEQ